MAATNTISAQAYKGQSVIITPIAGTLGDFLIGEMLVVASSGKIGTICEIDTYGSSFKVTPLQPNFRFDGDGTPGILGAGETISVYEP